jgi:hypothetical protein
LAVPPFFIMDLENFYNTGFGWTCRACERQLAAEGDDKSSRLLSEGEAESKNPRLSAALARWADPAQTVLICPRCSVTEIVDKR